MTVEIGVRFGKRFKMCCVWCLHHNEFCACKHEMKDLEKTIECPEYDDIYEMTWRWFGWMYQMNCDNISD